MPKIAYITKDFREETLDRINTAIGIIEEYQAQGFDLTLRQLYYQMVARGYIENSSNSYSNFGNNIDDARMSGLIDWDSIVDRTRNLQSNPHWRNPESIMHSVLDNYQIDKWRNQKKRVEVWVEKEALIGVLASVCNGLDVSYFACRGYTSQSEMWAAGQRFLGYVKFGIEPVILYLGDHDPSGIDMTRDVAERMKLFTGILS